MLSAGARARLAIVLVGARNPQNIGAAARAMQDFGFSDLRVVNEYSAPFEAAQLAAADTSVKSAVGAANVMQAARRFTNLAEAIADCTLVAGTTAIGGRELQREVITLQRAAPQLFKVLSDGDRNGIGSNENGPRSSSDTVQSGTRTHCVALLFGSEKTGLTNEQLSHCSILATIPMFAPLGARHLSMNLGQSVAVCLYELVREGFEGVRDLPAHDVVEPTAEDRERLTQLLLEAMWATGYARRFPANSREHIVRQLAQQLGSSRDEASTWMGLFRQVVRYEREGNSSHVNGL